MTLEDFACKKCLPCQLNGRHMHSLVFGVTKWPIAIAIKQVDTVYPKKYAHGFCFAVLCCGYTLTDFPISIRLTSLALWQSNDCPSASKATLIIMAKYFMWIHYERLHNHKCELRQLHKFSTNLPLTKWPPFRCQYFQIHTRDWIILYFDKISLKFVLEGSIYNDKGLVANTRKAIIRTNANPIRWRMYAALGS